MRLTLLRHELKRNKLSMIIWSSALSFMLGVCVLMYPIMEVQMAELATLFESMGAYGEAFGLDEFGIGDFMSYFGTECGETLGLGAIMLAAILGISALSKEERDSTAELLLTLPISRSRIATEKLIAVIIHLVVVNVAVTVICVLSALAISADASYGQMLLILLSYLLLQIEVASITFGLSSLIKRGGIGIGIGIGFGFYFINMIANLAEAVEFLRYITPFGYANAAHIISEGYLEPISLIIGVALATVSIVFAYRRYERKDIA